MFLFSSMDTLAKFLLRSYPLPPADLGALRSAHVVDARAAGAAHRVRSRAHDAARTAGHARLLLVASTALFYLRCSYLPLAEAAAHHVRRPGDGNCAVQVRCWESESPDDNGLR